MAEAAAWIYQADTLLFPASPISPHWHLVGALTATPARPLPNNLQSVCDAAGSKGFVYVSLGTTNTPGMELQCIVILQAASEPWLLELHTAHTTAAALSCLQQWVFCGMPMPDITLACLQGLHGLLSADMIVK